MAGKTYALPGDLEGEINLVLVAFQRWHQAWVDTWLPTAAKLAAAYPKFRYYEMPTIQRMNPLFRWSIDSGMRAGIADKQAHAVTITLYIDKAPFRAALDLPSEETIYALLIDRTGEVCWRAQGPLTLELETELITQVAAVV